ncbi:MAG TPA: glycosyltransferase [Flavobacterium sp.]|nr:glycosyltransferase [Flavobacterium sp.]
MSKNIAFFVFSLEAGGIEKYLLRFLTHYQTEINATVYCKSGKTGILEEDFRQIGAEIVPFKLGYFNNLKPLKKVFKENNFEAVVDFTNNFAAFPLLAAKDNGIKTRVAWYRNADVKFKKTLFKVLYNGFVNRLTRAVATDILSNSKVALDVFYKGYKWGDDKRFEVIYNGIDSEGFLLSKRNLRNELSIPDHAFVVGHIGRYDEQKNHKTAIEVALQLCKSHPDIYFIFVGRGVDLALSQEVVDADLEKRILLLGNRNDIPAVLNTFDCFYFPSTLEGNPNALIEAMIAGLPFIASNIEPIKEAVPQDVYSFLVPPLDVSVAVQSILKVKENKEFRTKLMCKDWALDKFNAEIQFGKFFQKI